MIKKHNSLARVEKIFNSFINSMYQEGNLDGVIEVFNQNGNQGYLMKIFKTYEPHTDLCVWAYEDLENKMIHTYIGTQADCQSNNNFQTENLVHNFYPVKIDVKKQIVKELIDYIYSYYDKSIKI